MSQLLINRSQDLSKLRSEGYEVAIRSGYLVVTHVPYVNSAKEVKFGTLVSELTLAGDVTTKPSTHVMNFAGEHPCDQNGVILSKIQHASQNRVLVDDLSVQHSFSSKPADGYADYYEKVTTYAAIISGPAQALNPEATAKTFPVIETVENESVFYYEDTASSRAEIVTATKKLELGRVAIIGLGGTGSYILDFVAKTPVKEIHLFDGDVYSQHNAFRSPGAPSVEELKTKPTKVAYFATLYSRMHRHIIPHPEFITAQTIDQLKGMDFAFLSLDKGKLKRLIVEKLEEFQIPFIDVGMGITLVDSSLLGVLRVTTSTNEKRDHVRGKNRIPFSDGDENNDYAKNIQVADLNALNATLAVIKWKKLFGFYLDLEKEHYSTFTLDGNTLLNEDQS